MVCIALAVNLYIFCVKILYKSLTKNCDEKVFATTYISGVNDNGYFVPFIENYYFSLQACMGIPCYIQKLLTGGNAVAYVENYFKERNNTKLNNAK